MQLLPKDSIFDRAAAAATLHPPPNQHSPALLVSTIPRVQSWARTPLWKRAEYLHRVAAIMRANAQPIADVLVKEVAKPASDAYTGGCEALSGQASMRMRTPLPLPLPLPLHC